MPRMMQDGQVRRGQLLPQLFLHRPGEPRELPALQGPGPLERQNHAGLWGRARSSIPAICRLSGREEVEAAARDGVTPVTLGRRILRTETAGMTVLCLRNRLQGTHFIISMHHGDQYGLSRYGSVQLGKLDTTRPVHGKIGHAASRGQCLLPGHKERGSAPRFGG